MLSVLRLAYIHSCIHAYIWDVCTYLNCNTYKHTYIHTSFVQFEEENSFGRRVRQAEAEPVEGEAGFHRPAEGTGSGASHGQGSESCRECESRRGDPSEEGCRGTVLIYILRDTCKTIFYCIVLYCIVFQESKKLKGDVETLNSENKSIKELVKKVIELFYPLESSDVCVCVDYV